MTPDEVNSLFLPLYADVKPEHQFNVQKPLLAHYTSLAALEGIVKNNEIWFSNPLLMNDLEELKFGINTGTSAARRSEKIKAALGNDVRYKKFLDALDHYYQEFDRDHVFDTYVFCASQHDPADVDGRLSMWRGYGRAGDGVALVLDTSTLNIAQPPTPLILSKVHYGTVEARTAYLEGYCDQAAAIIAANAIPDELVYVVSYALFDRIKLFSLFTKHRGFEEEHEWRAVYRRDIDREKKYDQLFGYELSQKGVEPKLKFKVAPIAGITSEDISLEKIVHAIILGPSTSSVLSEMSVKRMLTLLGHPKLAERVSGSNIPLRSSR